MWYRPCSRYGVFVLKKSLFIVGLSFISENVCGMVTDLDFHDRGLSKQVISGFPIPQAAGNSRQPIGRYENSLNQASKQSHQEASTSSNSRNKLLKDSLLRDAEYEENMLRQKDPETLKKIEDYVRRRKKYANYSQDQIKMALIRCCVYPKISIKDIAEMYGVHEKAIHRCASKIGVTKSFVRRNSINEYEILERYKNGGTLADICKLVVSNECNAKMKFAEVISKKITNAQKKQFVEENMDIIKEDKKGLLTLEGLINKYKDREIQIGDLCTRKFGECENYLLHNIANKLGYDLSKISVKWDKKYKSSWDVPKHIEQSIIEEFNKGFLTYKGISQKYGIKERTTQTILLRRNRNQTYRRNAKPNNYKYVNLKSADIVRRLQGNLGYQQSTAKRFKICINQYYKLSINQKKLFKELLSLNPKDREMPSYKYLEKIKSENNRTDQKFYKFLTILCGIGEEKIREKFHIIGRSSFGRLKRGLNIWINLAKQEMKHDQED